MQSKQSKDSLKTIFMRGLTELLVLICAILFFFIIYKINAIRAFFAKVLSILLPIIVGLVLAYLLNPVMMFFESRITKFMETRITDQKKRATFSRLSAILISLVILMLFISVLVGMVFPLIRENIANLINVLPKQMENFGNWVQQVLERYDKADEMIDNLTTEGVNYLTNWVKKDMMGQMSVVISGVVGAMHIMLDLMVGLVVMVYVLMSKETFKRQGTKLIYAFMSDGHADMTIEIIKEANRIFGGFISGKIVDSLIIGILCFIATLLLNMPYAALVSVIVGVTNVIPFFGPFIGGIPSAILILLANPMKGLVFIVLVVLLQQFDGNILGPRILGDSTGLSPFWVVFSILLGGGLFGVIGMLVGVPTFGVIYFLVRKYVNYRLKKKKSKYAENAEDDRPETDAKENEEET